MKVRLLGCGVVAMLLFLASVNGCATGGSATTYGQNSSAIGGNASNSTSVQTPTTAQVEVTPVPH